MHMLFAFACLLAVFTTASAQAATGITSVTSIIVNTTDGARLGLGSVLAITVTFNATVYVNLTANDDIQLALNSDNNAIYSSGSGTNALVFLLTVGPDDTVTQLQFTGVGTSGVFVFNNNANITDVNGDLTEVDDVDYDPTLITATDVFTNFEITLDVTLPTIVSVTFATGNYTLNSLIPLYVKFSEQVRLAAGTTVTIRFLGLNFVSIGINATDNTVINFQAVVTASVGTPVLSALNPALLQTLSGGISVTLSASNAITDTAGNVPITAGATFILDLANKISDGIVAVRAAGTFVIDAATGITAIIGIYSDQSNVNLTVGQTINIYVQFDRSVTLTLPSLSAAAGITLTLNNGGVATLAASTLITASPTLRFTYTVRSTDGARIAPNYLDVNGASALSLGTLAGITLLDGIAVGNVNLATPSGTTGTQPAGQNTTLGRNNIQVNPTSTSNGNVIISITSPNSTGTSNVYSEGDDLWINVTFSATVIVSGTPTITLNNGRSAIYNSRYSTSRSIIFVYTVTSDDNSDDQIAIANRNAIRLNSGSINDVATSTAANITIPSGISLNLGYYADGSTNDNNDVIARIIVEFYDVNSCGSQALQDDEDAIAQIIQDNFDFTFNDYKETSCNGINKRQDYASDVTLSFEITDFNGNEGDFFDNQDDVRDAINNIDGVELISLDFSASSVLMPTLFSIALLFVSLLMRN